jgi:hypothetical protein
MAKLVVCAFILHVIQAREPVLVSLFLPRARCTCVPILNIESTREAHILVQERFCDVGKMDIEELCVLHACGDVGNHLVLSDIQHWHQGSLSAACSSATSCLASTAASATSAALLHELLLERLLILWLVLWWVLMEGWG